MTFLHIYIPRYFNLAIRFLRSCDHHGNFDPRADTDPSPFRIDSKVENMLQYCHRKKDSSSWMTACEPLAVRFNIVRVDNIFLPHLH